uniref:Uncharacterized protein n=1 Tax=Grammatophora oceanica TaxID=210454 RepID=A0A7S1VJZ5_9STRA
MQSLGNVLGNSHLSKPVSSLVGRTTVEGSQDLSVRTIFVGISSYRDWHCRYTLESVFARAKHPERLRIAVVDQLDRDNDQSCFVPIVPCEQKPDQALCAHRDQIDVYEMESNLVSGPTFTHHILNRMYRGEYYALLVDPHTTFVKDWDANIVQQLESTKNDMAVLTTYLDDALGSIDDITGTTERRSRQVICDAEFDGSGYDRRLRHDPSKQPDSLPAIQGMPQLQPFWSSSFSFSRGHFVLTVPSDPFTPMVRREDMDISVAIRAFTHGYDFYAPERSVAFDSAYSDRGSRKTFLEHKDVDKGHELMSYKRLYGIVGLDGEKDPMDWANDPHELYGIGHARPLASFWNAFGIHASERITERKLCNFVQTGRMHKLFHDHLRPDGMGLDYEKISFRFHELQNNHDA